MLRGKKGITLIALVITIIVLLILAGVTIATLTGDNGILTRASEAKEENIEAQEKEKINLAWQSITIKRQADNISAPVSDEELKNQLIADGENANNIEVTGGTGLLKIKYNDSTNTYIMTQDGILEDNKTKYETFEIHIHGVCGGSVRRFLQPG